MTLAVGYGRLVRRYAANVLTLLRMALAPAFASSVLAADRGGCAWVTAAIFALAAASDVVDGRAARRYGTASSRGRALDHAADIAFLLVALATYVALGVLPWWVPAAVAASFACYAVDARWPPPRPPRWGADRLGHLGGIGNWVLVGVLIGNHSAGLAWLSPRAMLAMSVAVLGYSAAAVAGRLAARS